MRPTFFDGRRDVRVKPAPWIRLHAPSTEVIHARCERCGKEESIDITAANQLKDAQRILGRFVIRHDSCLERDEPASKPQRLRLPVGKRGRMVLVGTRYVNVKGD